MNQLNIKVLGLGEGGALAVNKMLAANIGAGKNVEFICVGTDENIMLTSATRRNLFLNRDSATLYQNFSEALSGAHIVFIVGGLGSTAARSAVPIITACAKTLGAATVAFVCRPSVLENLLRKMNADFTLKNLRGKVDTLFELPAEKFFLFRMNQPQVSLAELFDVADEVFFHGVKIFLDMLTDDADLMLCRWGNAAFGYGEGKTAPEAIKSAAKFPMLDGADITAADGIFVSLSSAKTLPLHSVESANNFIRRQMKPDAEFFSRESIDAAKVDKIFAAIICTRKEV